MWFTGRPQSGKSTLAGRVRDRLAASHRSCTLLDGDELRVALVDTKGLYARARASEAPTLPGVGMPYESPLAPDFTADGGHDDVAVDRASRRMSRARRRESATPHRVTDRARLAVVRASAKPLRTFSPAMRSRAGTPDATPWSVGYTSVEHQLQHVDDPPPDQVTVASGSWFEVCCGALGLAVAVIGILGTNPPLMGAIATVVLGFGVFAHAGTIVARSNRCAERDEFLGISVDLVAGLVGIGFGALVLLRIVPFTWHPIATMALGTGLMFAARVEIDHETPSMRWNVWSQVVMSAAGLSAMVLALGAFAAVAPMTMLALVAVACVGGGLLLAGGGPLTVRWISSTER